MEDHIQCFKYLWMITGCLATRKCLEQVGPFKEAVRNHHRMYVELYGDMVKPKLHYLRHVVDSITHFGKVLSCFVTERRHKVAKQQALRVFKNLPKHALANDIRNHVENIKKPEAFQDTKLMVPIQNAREVAELLRIFNGPCADGLVARELHTPTRSFQIGHMVLFGVNSTGIY